jgi:hypothetical protein
MISRDRHDRDLAARVVDLILAEDLIGSRLHPDSKSRMIERIVGTLGLARLDEKERLAPSIDDALNALGTFKRAVKANL